MVVVKSDIKNKDCVQNIDGGFGGRSPRKKFTVLACKFLVPTHDSIYVSAILSEKIILSWGVRGLFEGGYSKNGGQGKF